MFFYAFGKITQQIKVLHLGFSKTFFAWIDQSYFYLIQLVSFLLQFPGVICCIDWNTISLHTKSTFLRSVGEQKSHVKPVFCANVEVLTKCSASFGLCIIQVSLNRATNYGSQANALSTFPALNRPVN